MTGYGSVESAVSCMQMGAFDYVVKPFSFDQIEVVVDKVASFDKMRRVTKYYVEESDTRSSDIVGESDPIKKLKNLAFILHYFHFLHHFHSTSIIPRL